MNLPEGGLCHNTLTPAGTPQPHEDVVMHGIVMQGLSSVLISSSHNSVHSPEMEVNPLKVACSCPCDGVIKNGHT